MKNENLDKLPSLEDLRNIITEIENTNLATVSYNKLFKKLISLQLIPFVTAKLKKGYHIERGRINKPDEIFTSEKDLSYRSDYENIKTYGRANAPQNPLFYGAFQSDIIKHPVMVNLLETSEIFRNLENTKLDDADFIMTVGKWRIKEDFEVVEIVFDEKSIKNSADVQRSYAYHLEKLNAEFPEHTERFELILKFFSNQFSKKNPDNNHYNYMVSAAYADMAINQKGFKGLIYPSVQTDYQGNNVVLTPGAVENFLELEVAAMFRVTKHKDHTIITPIKHTTEFGPMNSEFKWWDIKPEDLIVKE